MNLTLNKRKNSPFRAHKTKDKREIDRRTIEYHPEMPEDFSDGLKDLLNGLLNKKPTERLGNGGAKDIMVSFRVSGTIENPIRPDFFMHLDTRMVQRGRLAKIKPSWIRSTANTAKG